MEGESPRISPETPPETSAEMPRPEYPEYPEYPPYTPGAPASPGQRGDYPLPPPPPYQPQVRSRWWAWMLGGCGVVALLALVACVLVMVLVGGLVGGLAVSGVRTLHTSVSASQAQTFPVSGAPVVSVTNSIGQVRVQTGASGTVTVEASRTAYGTNSQTALDNVRVNTSQNGNTITINTSTTGQSGIPRYEVNLTITVPQQADITVEQNTGNITVANVQGHLALHTNVGRIQTQGVTFVSGSSLHVETGDIAFSGTLPANSTLDLRVATGSISGSLVLAAATHIDAVTNIGSITLTGWNIPVTRNAPGASASGDVKASGAQPSSTLTIRVQTGSIALSDQSAS